MKLYKPKKQLKNTREVENFFIKRKDGVIPYKGGFGVVRNKTVVKVFVGENALENARKDK